MKMRFHQDPCMYLDSPLLLEKIQGADDDLRQCGDRKKRKPVNGAAGDEIGLAIFYYSVSASSHGIIVFISYAVNEAEPLRMHTQAEPGNEIKSISRTETRELRRYRHFYQTYPQIRDSLNHELKMILISSAIEKRESLTPIYGNQLISNLSFTHITELVRCEEQRIISLSLCPPFFH